jgi:hypothetical protein
VPENTKGFKRFMHHQSAAWSALAWSGWIVALCMGFILKRRTKTAS